MGSQPPLDFYRPVVLHGLQVEVCSTVDLHGLQRDNLPHYGPLHRLQGNLCSSTWRTSSSSSFFTDLGTCRAVSLTCSHSSLLQLQLTQVGLFPPSYVCYHRGATTIADGLGLGQQRVHLGPVWHWLHRLWGKLLAASSSFSTSSLFLCSSLLKLSFAIIFSKNPTAELLGEKDLPTSHF